MAQRGIVGNPNRLPNAVNSVDEQQHRMSPQAQRQKAHVGVKILKKGN